MRLSYIKSSAIKRVDLLISSLNSNDRINQLDKSEESKESLLELNNVSKFILKVN